MIRHHIIYSIAKATLWLCFAMLLPFSSFSQTLNCISPPNCIVNPGMASSNGLYGDLYPWGNAQITGWDISHGTPTSFGEKEGIWMWSYLGDTRGEGIYTCFNFQQNHTYKICLEVMSTSLPGTLGNTNGIFFIQATNGSFNRPIPIANQLIAGWNMVDQQFSNYSYTFTANHNYTKLWLFPYMSNPPDGQGSQYEAIVRNVRVEEVSTPVPEATVSEKNIQILNSPAANGFWSWSPAFWITAANSDSSAVTVDVCSTTLFTAHYISDCQQCSDYSVQAAVNGSLPSVSISGSQSTCANTSLTLTAAGADQYLWQPGYLHGSTVHLTPQTNTTYTLYGTTGNCTDTIHYPITVYPIYQTAYSDTLCPGARYVLPDGRIASTPGTYSSILLSVNECDSMITIKLIPDNCLTEIMIPNLITPNNDQRNDRFEIIGLPENSVLKIYNRWSQVIYQNQSYDGRWKGDENSDGVYFYDLLLPDQRHFTGWMEILR